jgi:hypothetical protein
MGAMDVLPVNRAQPAQRDDQATNDHRHSLLPVRFITGFFGQSDWMVTIALLADVPSPWSGQRDRGPTRYSHSSNAAGWV